MQRKHFYAEAGKRLEQMKADAEENNLHDNSLSKTSLNKNFYKTWNSSARFFNIFISLYVVFILIYLLNN